MAAPIPFAPPVTRAVFPSNLMRATLYGGHMEFRDILARRRMHRAFLPDPIPHEQIERIANVIRRAPSGGFSQGGSIVVVTDDDSGTRSPPRSATTTTRAAAATSSPTRPCT